MFWLMGITIIVETAAQYSEKYKYSECLKCLVYFYCN